MRRVDAENLVTRGPVQHDMTDVEWRQELATRVQEVAESSYRAGRDYARQLVLDEVVGAVMALEGQPEVNPRQLSLGPSEPTETGEGELS